MYCQQCGKELPAGAEKCPSCSAPVPGQPSHSPMDPVDQAVKEAKQAAKDLMAASARISRMAIDHAEAAGRDPSGTARKAARRVAQELDEAARKVDQALKEL